jgi:hypothetical protein
MSLASGYNPRALHPQVFITNQSGDIVYTFTSKQLQTNPTQDFRLSSLSINLGLGDDFGNARLIIHDHSNIFTDSTDVNRPSVISREWGIQIYLGHTLATKYRAFYGKIKDVVIERPSTSLQVVTLTCVGWGIILRERISRIYRAQKKASDGVTLDDTDTATRIDKLLLDIFEDKDHQVDDNISKISSITAQTSTTGNGICEDCTAIKIAQVNYTLASYAQIISNLVGITNSTWHINQDRALIVQDPGTHDSGILLTNDLSSSKTLNWDAGKLGYILNSPLSWADTSADTWYSFIHGYGHFSPNLVSYDNQTPNAAFNLDTKFMAIPFTVPSDNIFKIAIRSTKTGTPVGDGKVEIWGRTTSPPHYPEPDDVRRSILLNNTTLKNLGTTTPSEWFEIPIKPKLDVTPNENLFLVFHKFGTSTNTFNVDYKTGTSNYYDSSDGTTWNTRVGAPAFRIYDARRLISTLENTYVASQLSEPRERMFPIRADMEEQTVRQTLLQAGDLLGRQRRMYSSVKVSPIEDRIELNTFCTLVDSKTGLNTKANIIGVSMGCTNLEQGVREIELQLDEFL